MITSTVCCAPTLQIADATQF